MKHLLRSLFAVCLSLCLFSETNAAPLVKPKPAPKPKKTYSRIELSHKIEKSRGAAPAREWTILYYLDADNDLEPFMLNDVDEMEVIGSTDNVNLVALVDRHPGYEPRDGNWTNTKLLYVTRDAPNQKLASQLVQDFQETDMADPATLARFVAYGISNFPAKKYALVLGDHGGSWPAMLNDESNNEHGLNMGDLRSVLEALKSNGAPMLDLIVFDMCLMSQLEVMDVIAPFAKYAVASEELEPGQGYPNHKVLHALTQKPSMDAREFAMAMVQEWADSYNEAGEALVTSAAIDLSKVPDLVTAVNDLAAAMAKAPPETLAAIGRARGSAHSFGGESSDLDTFDLGHFCALLSQQPEAASLKPQLGRVQQALGAAVIKHEEGRAFPYASGLAIYFPFGNQIREAYKSLPFARTQWDEFLASKGSAAESLPAGIQIQGMSKDQVYDLNDSSWKVKGKVSGTVSSVHMSLGLLDSKTGELTVLSNEEVIPAGSQVDQDGSFVPVWKDGAEFEIAPQPMAAGVTDGRTNVIVPLFPLSPGSKYVSTVGAYHSKLGDKKVSAVFDMSKLALEALFCMSEGNAENPMAVKPVKGEDIVLFQVVFKEDRSPGRFRPVKALEVSDQLKVVKTALPAGEYVLMFTALGADGKPAARDWIQVKASGEGAAAGFQYPDYGYPPVAQDDLEYVDLQQIIEPADYNDFEGGWDDYMYMDEYEEDDFDADDLDYLDEIALDEEELNFDEENFYDYDDEEDISAEDEDEAEDEEELGDDGEDDDVDDTDESEEDEDSGDDDDDEDFDDDGLDDEVDTDDDGDGVNDDVDEDDADDVEDEDDYDDGGDDVEDEDDGGDDVEDDVEDEDDYDDGGDDVEDEGDYDDGGDDVEDEGDYDDGGDDVEDDDDGGDDEGMSSVIIRYQENTGKAGASAPGSSIAS